MSEQNRFQFRLFRCSFNGQHNGKSQSGLIHRILDNFFLYFENSQIVILFCLNSKYKLNLNKSR